MEIPKQILEFIGKQALAIELLQQEKAALLEEIKKLQEQLKEQKCL